MKQKYSGCAVALLLCCISTGAVADEASTYFGLWGNLFNTDTSLKGLKNYKNPIKSKATGLFDGAEEVHSKLLQRLADMAVLQRNHTGPNITLSDSNEDDGIASQLRSLFGGSTSSTRTPADNLTALCQRWESSEGSNMERLCKEFNQLEYHQLIATAMLQGWALLTILSKHGIHHGKLSKPTRPSARPADILDTSIQKGADWEQSFDPVVCAGLQNFGSAEGYRFVYLGPPPCGSPASMAENGLVWGLTGAFLLQCDVVVAGTLGSQDSAGAADERDRMTNAEAVQKLGDDQMKIEDATGIGGRVLLALGSSLAQLLQAGTGSRGAESQIAWGERQGALSSKLGALLGGGSRPWGESKVGGEGSSRLACQLSVTSSSGRGTVLQYGDVERLVLSATGPINAVRVRICNRAPYNLREAAASQPLTDASSTPNSSSITLRDLYIGGKPAVQRPLTVYQHTHSDGCTDQLFRVGGNVGASASSLTVSGWLDLAEVPGFGYGGFGVGDMASIAITLGSYNLQP